MNIEEAIKILEELKKNEWGELLNCWDYGTEAQKAIETLLTAYEKEKEKNKRLEKFIESGEFTWKQKYEETFEYVKENFINQDKIKEILGIEENIDNEKLLSLLQTIVDENVRLEDIEDRKVQIEYNNVFNKGVKSVEDKIKAKIEPVLKQLERKMEEEYNKYGNSREYQDIVDAYNFLQSLLEKE